MKYLLLMSAFLITNTSSATIFSPLLGCESKDPQLTFRLDDPKAGSLYHGKKICRFSVSSFEEKNQRVSNPGYDIVFDLDNCHPDTFMQKGFLRITFEGPSSKNVTAHILALKGHQTLSCKSSLKGAREALEQFQKSNR